MESGYDVPILLELIFGEAAGTALRGACSRLLLWSRAFEDWLDEREQAHSKDFRKRLLRVWRRLYRHCHRMPWEIRQADIAEHVERLAAEGYAPKTIASDLSMLSSFFRWCGQKRLDPECDPSFNPCTGVPHPRVKSYQVSAPVLGNAEIAVLLRIMSADRSAIGLRDYAFILARLNLGIPFRELQRLQWGQISAGNGSAWVCWRPEAEPARIPDEVTQDSHTSSPQNRGQPGAGPGFHRLARVIV
jgi:integrase